MKKILSREVGQGTCQGVVILHREVRKKKPAEKVNFERMKDEGQVRRLSVGVMRGGIWKWYLARALQALTIN